MNRSRLIDSIKRHEGYRQFPYQDHLGNWTVGWGHLIEYLALRAIPGDTFADLMGWASDPQRHADWLREDIMEAERAARMWYGGLFAELSTIRQEVVTEMFFQMGGGARFPKMKAALKRHDYDLSAAEMLNSRWASQTPNRAQTLALRMVHG